MTVYNGRQAAIWVACEPSQDIALELCSVRVFFCKKTARIWTALRVCHLLTCDAEYTEFSYPLVSVWVFVALVSNFRSEISVKIAP